MTLGTLTVCVRVYFKIEIMIVSKPINFINIRKRNITIVWPNLNNFTGLHFIECVSLKFST